VAEPCMAVLRHHPNVRRVGSNLPQFRKVDPSGVSMMAVQCFDSSDLAPVLLGEEEPPNPPNILLAFLNEFLNLLESCVDPAAVNREQFFADRVAVIRLHQAPRESHKTDRNFNLIIRKIVASGETADRPPTASALPRITPCPTARLAYKQS
jgi:hypothetical protein